MKTRTMAEVDQKASRMYMFVAFIQMLTILTLLLALMQGVARAEWTVAEQNECDVTST